MFDDSQNNPQPNQSVTNDPAQAPSAAANPPSTPASPSTPPVQPPLGASDVQPTAPGGSSVPAQNLNPSARPNQDQVSNTPPPVAQEPHPAVKRASVLYEVAQALAGGPHYNETIDADGNRVKTPVKMSGRNIAMAIALEAISGSLTGLQAGRGHGPGAAGAAAMQQSMQRRQQEQLRQDATAKEDFNNRSAVIARKAQIAEVNSRTILNTAESEKYGAEAIDKLVDINRASGVLDVEPGNVDNSGVPMTQQEMMDAIKAGKISTMDQLGPIAGRVEVTNTDGSKRWEATHLIVRDPKTPVEVSQEQWDRFAAAHVPGFPAGVKIGNGTELKLSIVQRANEVLGAHSLSDYRLKEIRDVLDGTPWADKVPASVDFSKPGVETAMQRFQKYVSHSNQHGMDVMESLQQMGQDKRDPRTGQMQPNPDAKYVDTVASAMGGWPVLQAVHNQLAANKKATEEFNIVDSEAKANAILASPAKFTRDQIGSARNFLTLSEQQGARKAAEAARERAVAEGKDVEAMFKTGVNPITKERLSLDNAPDGALVDSKGRPVPQNMTSFYKPSQNERQTADTARQALAISADLRAAVQKNPNLVGPLLGNSKSGLAKLGLGDSEAQKFLDDISFLQSAATKVHTGRFSSEILKKMGNMIKPGMNPQQFVGGLNSIDEVMNRYAQEDKLVTVADYKQMQQPPAGLNTQSPPTGATMKVPGSDGKMHWSDGKSDLGVAQ
jgi:hypothetical protein